MTSVQMTTEITLVLRAAHPEVKLNMLRNKTTIEIFCWSYSGKLNITQIFSGGMFFKTKI